MMYNCISLAAAALPCRLPGRVPRLDRAAFALEGSGSPSLQWGREPFLLAAAYVTRQSADLEDDVSVQRDFVRLCPAMQ